MDVSDDVLKESGIADNPVAGMALCDSVRKFREEEHGRCVATCATPIMRTPRRDFAAAFLGVLDVSTSDLPIVVAIRLRKEIEGEWMLILAGLASVVFGVLLMAQPGAGALALLWLIGAYAVIFGVLLVILAFTARNFGKQFSG